MSEEILVNVTPRETRVAVVENGVLQEVFIERAAKRGLVGNIYKGRVSRVLPGMQAAFVDIGLSRAAFLHASDITPPEEAIGIERRTDAPSTSLRTEKWGRDAPSTNLRTEKWGRDAPSTNLRTESITEMVRDGQEVLVQVVKDPLGTKGARLTTQISIPSRFLVFMPGGVNIGVSQKIEDETERNRLKEIVAGFMAQNGNGSFIVRTAAEGAIAEDLEADMHFLEKLWRSISERAPAVPSGNVVHEDLPLALRTLRDLLGVDVEKVRIDSRTTFEQVLKFVDKYVPEVRECIEYYPGERPIFDLYAIEDEIHKALERKVQLKSGGYLIIDQTEAMTTVDVNTGGYVGHRNLEETIFKTNLEAAQAIARQLRLRNLGGIIIIDFIDMQEEEHKVQVLQALEKSLAKDHARSHITEVSALGLVEMTRKRTRESLEHVLCEPCSTCSGRGSLKTAETVCYEVFRDILREARQFDAKKFLVLASQEVVDLMLDEESTSLAELEAFIGKPIKFQVESSYTQEHFDVVLM